MTGQVDRVVEVCPAGIVSLRNRARSYWSSACHRTNTRPADGAFENAGVFRKVRQQVHVKVEADDHGFVFLPHHFPQKTRSRILFRSDHVVHAAARVD